MGLSLVNLVREIALRTKTERLLVGLRKSLQILRPIVPEFVRRKVRVAIPGAAQYPKQDRYEISRAHARFIINRSDYVQWRMFYGVKDVALEQAKAVVTEHSIALDIGASFGAFSLCLADHIHEKQIANCHVYAFEPNPEVFHLFQNNLSLNQHLASLVTVNNFGLGELQTDVPFAFTESNTGAGRVTDQSLQLLVKIKSLDEFLRTVRPAKVSFIKLIAGSYEPKIIRGAWQTITKDKPAIFLEVTENWWKEHNFSIKEVLAELHKIGYTFKIQNQNKMAPFDHRILPDKNQYYLLATTR